jgi:hypothetical protein
LIRAGEAFEMTFEKRGEDVRAKSQPSHARLALTGEALIRSLSRGLEDASL